MYVIAGGARIVASMGRPTKFNQEIADTICDRIANGESLRALCSAEGMPSQSMAYRWLIEHPEFREQYARAREAQADKLAEEILQIADTPVIGTKVTSKEWGDEITEADMIEHRKLQVDARKWIASKLAPKKYGDKLAVGGADDLPPIQTMSDADKAARLEALIAAGLARKAQDASDLV